MSPKTLTGDELQLDDGPARDSELFLVDGNNLAYRAYFALPEELATSDGFSTNALLGFTNMLFKLLSDYRPRGVAVAWDTRPVHRTELSADYKSDRRPMPDLLREQFPHFRPIVEAFGYRNLEFEGWEADDVIATLAHAADEAGLRTTVVSTDRDAFQLVSDNVSLMMTPRGVSDVHVYTPERVEARYGIRPDQIPDFIGLKGDSSDNIPGVPGIGDKTAGQLIAQYGSLEGVLDHVDDLSPARARNIRENTDQARNSKVLATMRRDLELDCDPGELVLRPPDRSKLKEMFRRYEFRNLLARVDELDEALPAAERPAEGEPIAWREEPELPRVTGAAALAVADGRAALAREGEPVVVAPLRPERLRDAQLAIHDAKTTGREPVRAGIQADDDTMLAAYLIEPARAAYPLDELANGVRHRGRSGAAGRGGDRGARPARRAHAAARGAAPRAGAEARQRAAVRRRRAAADRRARRHGGRRCPDRHVPHGRDHRAPARSGRGARGDGARARGRGVHARLDAAARPRPVREARAHAGPQGEDGVLDRHARPPLDPAEHEIVAVIEEWRELTKLLNTYLEPLPASSRRRTAACTRPSTRRSRRPGDCRPRTRTCRRSRSGRSSAARSGRPSSPSLATACSRRTTRRSSCASWPTSRASRSCARRSRAARTSTPPQPPRCSARIRRR